jgi:hypothetical protein
MKVSQINFIRVSLKRHEPFNMNTKMTFHVMKEHETFVSKKPKFLYFNFNTKEHAQRVEDLLNHNRFYVYFRKQ